MSDSTIKETSELVRFIGAGVRDYVKRKEDGEFSGWDGAKMAMALANAATDAVVGVQNVGNELLSITPDQQEELGNIIASELVSLGVSHRSSEIAIMWLSYLIQGAQLAKITLSLPPTAEPVTD